MTTGARTFTVTVRRGGGKDTMGDVQPGATHTIDGCTRWPRGSSETTLRANVVTTGWMLSVPVGSDLLATDQVHMPDEPDDEWWDVEGDPLPYVSPYTGRGFGMPVALTRTTG